MTWNPRFLMEHLVGGCCLVDSCRSCSSCKDGLCTGQTDREVACAFLPRQDLLEENEVLPAALGPTSSPSPRSDPGETSESPPAITAKE